MSSTTKQLVRDAAQNPVPQYYNSTADAYEPAQGLNGKQFVQASELETLLGALNGAAVTDPTLSASIIQILKGQLKQMQGTGTGNQNVTVATMLPAGTNNIGKVDVNSLPVGTNNIGKVDVNALPVIPAGANLIGSVKLSDGTDALLINANGSLNIVNVNAAGTELFTAGNAGKVDLNTPIPAGANKIGSMDIATVPKVGAHANAWNNIPLAAAGTSASVSVPDQSVVTVFGNASAATDIIVQVSQNNATFYDSDKKVTLTAAGDFCLTFDSAAAYVRLKSSAAATITATITAKG